VRVDVSEGAEIAALVARAQELGGPIDLFFSNAGVGGPPGGPEADDAGIGAERFLIVPRPDVAKHIAFKGAQPERWLEGMRGLLRRARDHSSSA
jgi:NAD(P)-dependent dehydrogenase (short-subunit alcohol dehydrogenase family)